MKQSKDEKARDGFMNEEMMQNIIQIQENERRRIAGALHDGTLQSMIHLTHQLELTRLYIDSDPAKAKLELAEMKMSLRDLISESRNIIYDIRPMTFDDLGFTDAMSNYIDRLNNKSTIKYIFKHEDIVLEESLKKLALYRCVQECLSNCEKHSKATTVHINMFMKDDIINIVIEDDGIGMDLNNVVGTQDNHFGLTLMRERIGALGGTYSVSSVSGKGTRVEFTLDPTY